jgi:hypothetical protein
MLVRFEDDVQNHRNLLLNASRRRIEQVHSERDQDAERLLDNGRQDVGFLAEPKRPPGELRVSQHPGRATGKSAPERADHLEHDHCACTDLADVVAREEGLGTVEQLGPPLRKVI